MADKATTIPAHVPPQLVVDFDTYNPPDDIGDYHRAIMQRTCFLKNTFQQPFGNFCFQYFAAVLVKLLIVIFGKNN